MRGGTTHASLGHHQELVGCWMGLATLNALSVGHGWSLTCLLKMAKLSLCSARQLGTMCQLRAVTHTSQRQCARLDPSKANQVMSGQKKGSADNMLDLSKNDINVVANQDAIGQAYSAPIFARMREGHTQI